MNVLILSPVFDPWEYERYLRPDFPEVNFRSAANEADAGDFIEKADVLVGGKRVPVVGRVCMDYIMVNLDEVSHVKEGDEVVLIGNQNGYGITAEELAERWGTINYEVVCGFTARVPRIYIK